jgi:hypothetical protein
MFYLIIIGFIPFLYKNNFLTYFINYLLFFRNFQVLFLSFLFLTFLFLLSVLLSRLERSAQKASRGAATELLHIISSRLRPPPP